MLYAWKLTAPGRPDHEQISTLEEIEAFLETSALPGSLPSKTIIERTRLMQHEGQGYYKSNTGLDEQWTLLWVMLSGGNH
jgi:hypothetical protein